MAKELPYFKFEPNEWENGNIQMCSREQKGLFIDLCAIYWSRLGDLPHKLAVQKLSGGNATALDSLCDEGIFALRDGYICIDFLDEQLEHFDNISRLNSKNAKEGWEKRRKQRGLSDRNATASKSQCESDAIREEERREEKSRKEKKTPATKIEIPTFEEFLGYAKTLPNYTTGHNFPLKAKYDQWVELKWKDGNGKKISNWKLKLNNTWTYIKPVFSPNNQPNTVKTTSFKNKI